MTVIATGNNGYCSSTSAPACISSAVSVGATTKSDGEAIYNNYSSIIQDIFAPGSGIYSAGIINSSYYTFKNGTSMATPHVAGAFALYRQAAKNAGVDEIERVFKDTGRTIQSPCGGSKPRLFLQNAIPDMSRSVAPANFLLLR